MGWIDDWRTAAANKLTARVFLHDHPQSATLNPRPPRPYPSNAEMAGWLRSNMSTVQSMFSSSNLKETKAAMDRSSAELRRKADKAADRARRGRRLTDPPG
jgi:hypothetical protein